MDSIKVLIIDDDPDFVEATKFYLESEGFDVDTAGNADSGFEHLAIKKPDVIILDMMMENKGEGFLFSRKMRKIPEYSDIPILMLTGMRQQTGFFFHGKDKDPYFLPVDEFMEKPIHHKELANRLREMISRPGEKEEEGS